MTERWKPQLRPWDPIFKGQKRTQAPNAVPGNTPPYVPPPATTWEGPFLMFDTADHAPAFPAYSTYGIGGTGVAEPGSMPNLGSAGAAYDMETHMDRWRGAPHDGWGGNDAMLLRSPNHSSSGYAHGPSPMPSTFWADMGSFDMTHEYAFAFAIVPFNDPAVSPGLRQFSFDIEGPSPDFRYFDVLTNVQKTTTGIGWALTFSYYLDDSSTGGGTNYNHRGWSLSSMPTGITTFYDTLITYVINPSTNTFTAFCDDVDITSFGTYSGTHAGLTTPLATMEASLGTPSTWDGWEIGQLNADYYAADFPVLGQRMAGCGAWALYRGFPDSADLLAAVATMGL